MTKGFEQGGGVADGLGNLEMEGLASRGGEIGRGRGRGGGE